MTEPTESPPEAPDASGDLSPKASGPPTFDEMLTAVTAFYRRSSRS